MIEYLNLKILNYILLLKWNILWNSYFQDSMSLYMMHLVAFHNRVLLYLVIILIAIIVCLINLFIPLSLNYLSNRTLPVMILTHYNLLPIKTYIIFILYKWFESWRSETIKEILKLWDEDSKRWTPQRKEAIDYKIYNYFLKLFGISNDENKYNYNIVSVKSDVYKKVTNISEDFNLELILSQDSWDIDLEDIELFLKQKQAANMLDYMPINRGFYWNDKNFNKFLSLDTMNKIRDLKSIKYFVGIFSSYKNIEPRLVNTKSNISKINYIYEILSFKHSKELEIFFTSIPTIIILTIISPSIALLIETDTEIEDPALYVKVQGSQWYWTYEIHHEF